MKMYSVVSMHSVGYSQVKNFAKWPPKNRIIEMLQKQHPCEWEKFLQNHQDHC